MANTPVHDSPLELQRTSVAAALQRARSTLLARPPAHALDVAQGVLMPLLHSLGVDVFDLGSFRIDADSSLERAEYRLQRQGMAARFVAVPADAPLPAITEESTDETATIACNGRYWLAKADGEEQERELELFDEAFPLELLRLLNGKTPGHQSVSSEQSDAEGAEEAQDTGEKPPSARLRQKEFVPAEPFERISLEEVRGYAEAVRNMRGKLQVWFDDEPVDITSRLAFYYVLAELAVRHGREDAIPGEDLVRPPDEPPASRRARPLARPGWQILVDHEAGTIEEHTLILLEALGLSRLFRATQRGEPYPPQFK